MQSETFVPTPQDLDLIDKVARAVARARGLTKADIDDFVQTVHLRMAERQYDVFVKFEGRASLRTYLTVVLARQLKDWQNREYGKWRPSAAAHRLGPLGAALDRELNRDGCSVEEAVRLVASRTGYLEKDVRDIADALPRRARRRWFGLDALPHPGTPFVDPVDADQTTKHRVDTRKALIQALAHLPTGEASLFVRRYRDHAPVSTLARAHGHEQKGLYRRFERIRRVLRAGMESRGVHSAPCVE